MAFGPLSTLPNGLANLFGLTGQATPKAFQEVIDVGLDVMPFIAAANCLEVLAPAAVSVNGASNSYELLRVPSTEAWLVRGITVAANTGGGDLFRGAVFLARGGSIFQQLSPEGTSSLNDAVGAGTFRVGSSGWFLAYPDDVITVSQAKATIPAPINFFVQAAIYRFTI